MAGLPRLPDHLRHQPAPVEDVPALRRARLALPVDRQGRAPRTPPTGSPRSTSCGTSCSACCARWWPPSRRHGPDLGGLGALRGPGGRSATRSPGTSCRRCGSDTTDAQYAWLSQRRRRRPQGAPRRARAGADRDPGGPAGPGPGRPAAGRRPTGRTRVVNQMLAPDPWEWRAVWLSGLLALQRGLTAAQSAFNAVYGQVPGELAPKLALALACELGGEPDLAERLYRTCASHRRQLRGPGGLRDGPGPRRDAGRRGSGPGARPGPVDRRATSPSPGG